MTVRVLLGSADDDASERLASMLGELSGYDLQATGRTSNEVLRLLAAEDRDILVIDEQLGPVPVLDLVRQVTRAHPLTAVVMLVDRGDSDTVRLAMEAGVRSLLLRSFTLADVESRLETAGTWATTVRRHIAGQQVSTIGAGRVIAFCGAKGGVGTTTVALHVALESAASGLRTCLVDLDLQTGDVAHLLNVRPSRDIGDLADIASGITARALEDVLYRHSTGLRVLLAPVEGEQGEEIDAGVANAVLGSLTSHFEVIVVDCGAVLGAAGAAAVAMATTAVVVTTPDTASVLGARRAIELWTRLSLRPEEQPTVLVNRVSKAIEVQPDLVQKMLRLTKPPLVIPSNFSSVEAAVNTGAPERLVERGMRRALATVAEQLNARQARTTVVEEPWRHRRRQGDKGQAAVETMGALFTIAIIVLALVQCVLIGASHVLVENAATAGAREAVLPGTPADGSAIRQAVGDELPGAWRSRIIRIDAPARDDPMATVKVTVRTPAVVPLMTTFFDDALVVSTRVALQAERR